VAELDVTDVLLDADVAGDTFTVLRRREVVSQNGVSTVQVNEVPDVLGSVQPTGDNSLIREESLDAQAKTIKVITTFRLRGPSQTTSEAEYKPDQIVWRGDTYEVKVLDDWTEYGGGMVEAECSQVTYVGTPPRQLAPIGGRADHTRGQNSAVAKGASR